MTLPTTLQVSGAGSSNVNGTYVLDGTCWRQSNGAHSLRHWKCSGYPVGWYLGQGALGMYFAEGGLSTFPTGGWKVYTGDCRTVACAPAPCFAKNSELENDEKSLRYGDHYYRVLDDTHPDEKMPGTQSEALQIPMGWEIVTETADIVANVIACHAWGTHVVVFGNGRGYRTAFKNYTVWGQPASFYGENLLIESDSYYKPTTRSCYHLRILIRQRA